MNISIILSLVKKVPTKLWGILALAAGLGVAFLYVQHLRHQIVRAETTLQNERARADKTVKLLSDSLTDTYRKLNIQEDLLKSKADGTSKSAPKVQTRVTTTIKTVTDTATGVDQPDSTVKFHETKEPFTLDAEFYRKTNALEWSVKTEPVDLGLEISCGATENGVRSALTFVQAPKWIDVVVDSTRQTRDVCNPETANVSMKVGPSVKQVAWIATLSAILGAIVYHYAKRK